MGPPPISGVPLLLPCAACGRPFRAHADWSAGGTSEVVECPRCRTRDEVSTYPAAAVGAVPEPNPR